MEQDIKDIELFIDFCRAPYNFEHESEEKSYKELSYKIDHLIKAYKELEENNSLLIQQNITYKRHIYDLKHNNIPVSLVEEKIEEYKNEIDKLYNQKVWNEPMDTIYKNRYVNYINILQELLEKRK